MVLEYLLKFQELHLVSAEEVKKLPTSNIANERILYLSERLLHLLEIHLLQIKG